MLILIEDNSKAYEEEEEEEELVICLSCEAEFIVQLGEDLLNENVQWCPFCGDRIVETRGSIDDIGRN